jgi:membrane protein implicated in regulation of membrane protease activity
MTRGKSMSLLVVFFVSLVIGQAISIGIGLMVERVVSPYAGLVTFIACYFAMFWVTWRFAVRVTERSVSSDTAGAVAEKQ